MSAEITLNVSGDREFIGTVVKGSLDGGSFVFVYLWTYYINCLFVVRGAMLESEEENGRALCLACVKVWPTHKVDPT